jgi:hypothetical protein
MNNLTQPAYPVVPLQDNFKRLVVPIPGLSKLEHFSLELYKRYKIDSNENEIAIMNQEEYNQDDSKKEYRAINLFIMDIAIDDAIDFLNLIEEKTKTLTNDKNDEMVIYNH